MLGQPNDTSILAQHDGIRSGQLCCSQQSFPALDSSIRTRALSRQGQGRLPIVGPARRIGAAGDARQRKRPAIASTLWSMACCGSTPEPVRSRSAARAMSGWTCKAVPDERSALETEITRLQGENAVLKKELLARGLPLPGVSSPPVAKPGEPELKLPSDNRGRQGNFVPRAGLAPSARNGERGAEERREEKLRDCRFRRGDVWPDGTSSVTSRCWGSR